MKSLDEVIYYLENKKGLLIGYATAEELKQAEIYYLKEYQKLLSELWRKDENNYGQYK